MQTNTGLASLNPALEDYDLPFCDYSVLHERTGRVERMYYQASSMLIFNNSQGGYIYSYACIHT